MTPEESARETPKLGVLWIILYILGKPGIINIQAQDCNSVNDE